MIIYLLQSSVVLSVLYLLYRLTLRRETLHGLSRTVLLLIVLCSLVLPACRLRLPVSGGVLTDMQQVGHTVRRVLVAVPQDMGGHSVQGLQAAHAETGLARLREAFTLGHVLFALYAVVAGLLLVHYVLSLGRYALLLRRSQRVMRVGHVQVYTHPEVASPISWGRTVVLSPDDLRSDLLTPVSQTADAQHRRHAPLLRHELAHIRLGHTLDRLLCDVAARLWWFCPAAWLLRADLEAVHEFQADAHVVRHGVEQDAYSALLVHKAVQPPARCAVHGWRASQIKRRLRMLYALQSRPAVGWRALLLLPVAGGLAVCMAEPAEIVRAVQRTVQSVAASTGHAASSQLQPAVPTVEAEVAEAVTADLVAQPADSDPDEDEANYVSRRLTTESIAELAQSFGLPEEAGYSSIVTIDGLTDAAVQYRVDDTPCDVATFARHAAVHFDEAHRTVWAFGKKGCHMALKAVPRLYAQQLYGVDAEVLVVYTQTVPPASPPVQRTMVVDGTDLYTVTSVYQADTSSYNKEHKE